MSATQTTTKLTTAEYIRKRNLFKGTISVCILYAVVALGLLLLIKYTERGKVFLEESNFPFAVSFAFGMLIVILILVIKIATFKVNTTKPNIYDDMMCPDFWKLKETSKEVLNKFSPEERMGKEYMCVRDANAPGLKKAVISTDSTDKYERQLAEMARLMYGESSIVENQPNKASIQCESLYPQYMSKIDVQNNPDIQNAMRCAYAEKCSLPWSAVCPDME